MYPFLAQTVCPEVEIFTHIAQYCLAPGMSENVFFFFDLRKQLLLKCDKNIQGAPNCIMSLYGQCRNRHVKNNDIIACIEGISKHANVSN
jgi:hypothetical protein